MKRFVFGKIIFNKLIFGHVNVNSLSNKFELLIKQVKSKIGILMISETKLDGGFQIVQFEKDRWK